MNLVFTSYGFRIPCVCDKLKQIISDISESKMLIVPFAGFDSTVTGLKEREAAIKFGFCEKNIFVADENNIANIKENAFEYIYVPGGNPFKLLATLKELDFLDIIAKTVADGAVYIGSSAGAYIACNSIEYVMQLEDNDYINDDFSALGLFNKLIICHYDVYGYSYYRSCAEKFSDYEIVTIDNDEVVSANNTDVKRF